MSNFHWPHWDSFGIVNSGSIRHLQYPWAAKVFCCDLPTSVKVPLIWNLKKIVIVYYLNTNHLLNFISFKNWLFAMMGIYKTCTCKYMRVCMVQGCRALQRQWPIPHVQRLDGNGPEVSETRNSSSWHSPCWRYNVPSVVTRHLPRRGRRI